SKRRSSCPSLTDPPPSTQDSFLLGICPSCTKPMESAPPHPPGVRPSSMNNNHLATGLVGFHHAVGFTDFVEAEDPRRLDVDPAGRGVLSNFLKRDIRERKARSSEHKAAEES